jgi:hypothetical protein
MATEPAAQPTALHPATVLIAPSLKSVFPASVAFHEGCDGSKEWKVSDFDIDRKTLGAGKFGRAFRVRHRASRRICVMKTMQKAAILEENVLSQVRDSIGSTATEDRG